MTDKERDDILIFCNTLNAYSAYLRLRKDDPSSDFFSDLLFRSEKMILKLMKELDEKTTEEKEFDDNMTLRYIGSVMKLPNNPKVGDVTTLITYTKNKTYICYKNNKWTEYKED